MDELNRGDVVSEQDPVSPAPKKKRRRMNPKRRMVKRLGYLRADASMRVDLTVDGAHFDYWKKENARRAINELKKQQLFLNKWQDLFLDYMTPHEMDERLRKIGLVLGSWGPR